MKIEGMAQAEPTAAQLIERLSQIGVTAAQQGYTDAARVAFIKATQVERRADILANAANAERVCWRFDAAKSLLDEALEKSPMDGRIWGTQALYLLDTNQHAAAVEAFDRSIQYSGATGLALFGRSQALLGSGRIKEGLEAYEARYQLNPAKAHAVQRWQGEPLHNKILHVEAEQGLGDTIMFSRFLNRIAGNYIFTVQPALQSLFAGSRRLDEDVRADYWCPLMSLPNLVGAELDFAPIRAPRYMPLPPSAPFNIGVFWKSKAGGKGGTMEMRHGVQKSCPVEALLDLAELPNVALHSLQYGEDVAAETFGIINQPPLHDFADLASYISQLDVIVGVDTAPIHLAGMMKKPALLLLNVSGSWQWGSGETTPWYPTVRILRQERPHDWGGVVKRVKDMIASVINAS